MSGDDALIYQHIVVVRSEHEEYEDLEALARDAMDGDAFLSAWNKEPFPANLLSDSERDFFFPNQERPPSD